MGTTLERREGQVAPTVPEPIVASEAERPAIARLEALLQERRARLACLVGPNDETIALPESAFRLLEAAIHQLSLDNAVSIVPVHKQLTTQQAADLLNISRPYLIRLLERGELPYEKVGTHRRLKLGEVLAYRRRRARAEVAALDALLLEGEELGL